MALKRTLESIENWLKEAKDQGINKECVLFLVGNKVLLKIEERLIESCSWKLSKRFCCEA